MKRKKVVIKKIKNMLLSFRNCLIWIFSSQLECVTKRSDVIRVTRPVPNQIIDGAEHYARYIYSYIIQISQKHHLFASIITHDYPILWTKFVQLKLWSFLKGKGECMNLCGRWGGPLTCISYTNTSINTLNSQSLTHMYATVTAHTHTPCRSYEPPHSPHKFIHSHKLLCLWAYPFDVLLLHD